MLPCLKNFTLFLPIFGKPKLTIQCFQRVLFFKCKSHDLWQFYHTLRIKETISVLNIKIKVARQISTIGWFFKPTKLDGWPFETKPHKSLKILSRTDILVLSHKGNVIKDTRNKLVVCLDHFHKPVLCFLQFNQERQFKIRKGKVRMEESRVQSNQKIKRKITKNKRRTYVLFVECGNS